jgi:hypothetical protein
MSNLLKDLLPDAPREKSILVAAAEAGLADTLRDHVSQGANPDMAVRLTASSFAATTPYPPDACAWVTDELAIALGLRRGGHAAQPAAGSDPAGQQWMPTQAVSGPRQDSGSPVAPPARGSWPEAGQGYPRQAPAPTAAAGYPPAPQTFGQQDFPQPQTFGQQDFPQPQTFGQQQAFSPPQDFAQQQGFSPVQDFPQASAFPQAPGFAQGPGPAAPAAPGFAQAPGFAAAPDPRFASAMTGYRGPKNNSLATAALICGVAQFIAWFIFLIPGFIAAALALIFGLVSMKQIRQTGESGRGLAVTGTILGALGLVGGIALIMVVVIGALHAQT